MHSGGGGRDRRGQRNRRTIFTIIRIFSLNSARLGGFIGVSVVVDGHIVLGSAAKFGLWWGYAKSLCDY
jgi:hypothetical protein